jgi:hypothetical protein
MPSRDSGILACAPYCLAGGRRDRLSGGWWGMGRGQKVFGCTAVSRCHRRSLRICAVLRFGAAEVDRFLFFENLFFQWRPDVWKAG